MPRASDFTRNRPKQRRAAVTLEALVEAGFRVLERDGAVRFSTTAVAESAGVSIGTLYQYFANKEDLLKAMAGREIGQLLQGIQATLEGPAGYRARPIVRAILRTFWEAPPQRQAAFPLLLRFVGRTELMAEVKRFTEGLGQDLALKAAMSDEAAFVVTRAVLGVVSAAVSEAHSLDRQRLEDELVLLILRYLDLPPAATPGKNSAAEAAAG